MCKYLSSSAGTTALFSDFDTNDDKKKQELPKIRQIISKGFLIKDNVY